MVFTEKKQIEGDVEESIIDYFNYITELEYLVNYYKRFLIAIGVKQTVTGIIKHLKTTIFLGVQTSHLLDLKSLEMVRLHFSLFLKDPFKNLKS